VIDEEHAARIGLDVTDTLQERGALRLQRVHWQIDAISAACEHDGDSVDPTDRVKGAEHPMADQVDALKAGGFV